MSWSLKFDEPIKLAKGRPLRTLRDAANYDVRTGQFPGHPHTPQTPSLGDPSQ